MAAGAPSPRISAPPVSAPLLPQDGAPPGCAFAQPIARLICRRRCLRRDAVSARRLLLRSCLTSSAPSRVFARACLKCGAARFYIFPRSNALARRSLSHTPPPPFPPLRFAAFGGLLRGAALPRPRHAFNAAPTEIIVKVDPVRFAEIAVSRSLSYNLDNEHESEGYIMENNLLQTLISDGVFSVAVAAYLLVRMEQKLADLTRAITELKTVIMQETRNNDAA